MPGIDLNPIVASQFAAMFHFPRDISRGWRPALMTDPADNLKDFFAPMAKSI
jgi:hypothetical protein